MTVRNIRGTSDSHRGTAWLRMWKEYNGIAITTPTPCCVRGCTLTAQVGAHVTKPSTGMRQFIVPMCQGHNQTYGVDLPVNTWASPMPVVQ